jgi:hypothetical protein
MILIRVLIKHINLTHKLCARFALLGGFVALTGWCFLCFRKVDKSRLGRPDHILGEPSQVSQNIKWNSVAHSPRFGFQGRQVSDFFERKDFPKIDTCQGCRIIQERGNLCSEHFGE